MIGIVWMSLVPKNNRIRQYFEEQTWAGEVTRLEWALLFLSTPVQFFIADVFHIRAYKEIKALWRPGSQVPILRRFYRFGSMNLLVSVISRLCGVRELLLTYVGSRSPLVCRLPTLPLLGCWPRTPL